MAEIDLGDFDARLNSLECSQVVRDIVGCLRQSAERAGPVKWRAHSTPGGGWGLIGRNGGVFCRFDPKPSIPHVCVAVRGAAGDELKAAGTVHLRKNAEAWVDIEDVRGAVLLDPLIARACAAAGRTLSRRPSTVASRPRTAGERDGSRAEVGEGLPILAHQPNDGSHSGAVREELIARGFAHVGWIRPLDAGRRCKTEMIEVVLRRSVVYGLIVGTEFKKCGDTGRKNATLKGRMDDCASTINKIIRGDLVGPFTEHFKSRAPSTIEASQEIEVWAREAAPDECERIQKELNSKYDTIRTGWTNRLK